jgi:hypothetical protein
MKRYMLFVRKRDADKWLPVGSIYENKFRNRLWDARSTLWDVAASMGLFSREVFGITSDAPWSALRKNFTAGTETPPDRHGNTWIAMEVEITAVGPYKIEDFT